MLAIERVTRSGPEVETATRCAPCDELEARGATVLWCRECGVGVEVADRWLGPRQVTGEAGAEAPF